MGGTDYTCTYTLITYMCTEPVTKQNVLTMRMRTIQKKTGLGIRKIYNKQNSFKHKLQDKSSKADRNEGDRKLKIEYCEII